MALADLAVKLRDIKQRYEAELTPGEKHFAALLKAAPHFDDKPREDHHG